MWNCTNCQRPYADSISMCTLCVSCTDGVCEPVLREQAIAAQNGTSERIKAHRLELEAQLKIANRTTY